MRKILSSVLILATGMVLLNSCKKFDIPQDVNTLGKGSYVKLDKTNNLILDYSNLSGSKASIDVSEYGAEQEKLTIYVSVGPATQDKTKWKKIKEVPNTNGGKYSLSVSGAEISTAIAPVAIAPGNLYTLYNVVSTKDGRTFDYANTATGFSGNPNYNMALSWAATVVCPFVGPVGGQYTVIQDDWVDWSPGDVVNVTDGPGANQIDISQVWPNPAYGTTVAPLIVSINPATGAATIPTGVIWANYGSVANPVFAKTGTPNSGFVFSCTGLVTLNIRIIYNNSDQGGFKLVLKKK